MHSSGPAQEAQAALDAIRRIVRLLRDGSKDTERRVGLSSAQLFVLQALASEDDLSINDLAARTLTHQSSVSVVVRKLEEQSLVERRRASDDGRRVALSLTAKGRALIERTPETAQARLIDGILRLSAGERRGLVHGLEALTQALGLHDRPPAMFFEDDPAPTKPRSPNRARS